MYLDLLRRKKRLKLFLWLVIVSLGLSMLLFFVPGQGGGVGAFDSAAATVDGETITVKDYVNTYRRFIDNFSAQGKNKLDRETIKTLGLGRQALDALINVKVVNLTAERLGLSVSPEEMRQAVESNPNFQDRGIFIGVERYKTLLAANRLSVPEFEDGVRFGILSRKIRNLISDSMVVTERELRDEFLRSSQEAQVRFVFLNKEDFKKHVTPDEASVRAHFEANKDKFVTKEQRKVQYLLIPMAALAATIKPTEDEIQAEWKRQGREENVEASHILFKVDDPAKEGEIKAKAEAVLKRAKAGEDFAELAKTNSEDPVSATQGGSLGTFGRGRMIKEFEDVAFSLKPGDISGVVRTQFGLHIIKVLRHDIPDLEASRSLITRTVQLNKASDVAKQKAVEAARLAETQKDLNQVAKALAVVTEIRETGFIAKDSDPLASGVSQPFVDEVFRLKEIGATGKAVDHPSGQALPKLLEIQLPKPPDFTTSRPRVEQDYIEVKARELIQAEAKKISDEAVKSGDIEKTAQPKKLMVKTTPAFKRGGVADPEIGNVPQFNDAAFTLPIGAVSPPISFEGGNHVAVLQVKSRSDFNEPEFEKQKGDLRNKILGSWKEAYFQQYIRQITEALEKSGKIRINSRAVDEVVG
jgi:peptidyl-prolyl cis-trans isomerase D